MGNFIFSINETLQRDVVIEAETRDEAEKKLLESYKNEEIVLDSEDFKGMEVEYIKELEKDFNHVHERRLQDFDVTQDDKNIFIDFEDKRNDIGFFVRDPHDDSIYYKYIAKEPDESKVEFLKNIERNFNEQWDLSTFRSEKDHGWNLDGKKIGEFETLVKHVCKSMNENELNIAEKEGYFIDERNKLKNEYNKILYKDYNPRSDFMHVYDYESDHDMLIEKKWKREILEKLENSDNTNEQKEKETSEKKIDENNIQTNKNKVKTREKEREM